MFPSVCILHVILATIFGKSCYYVESIQTVFVVTRLRLICKLFGLIPYNSVVVFFVFFLIISKGARERDLVNSGLIMEIPELSHWHNSDLYFLNSGHILGVSLLKVIIVFINTVCALSLSDVALIWSLLLTLSRRQSFPSRQEHFLIQNTFRNSCLVSLLLRPPMNR